MFKVVLFFFFFFWMNEDGEICPLNCESWLFVKPRKIAHRTLLQLIPIYVESVHLKVQ